METFLVIYASFLPIHQFLSRFGKLAMVEPVTKKPILLRKRRGKPKSELRASPKDQWADAGFLAAAGVAAARR